jgi:uroporphyrinogen-III synthase
LRQAKLILFTDSKMYNHEFAAFWQAKGYQLQHLPLLISESIDLELFYNDKIAGIIITSTNAIDALQKYFPNKSIKIYTISKVLAEKIKVQGYQNIYFATSGQDSSSLAETFTKHPPQGMLLHLCGEKVRHDLNFKGIAIKALPVYKMCEIVDNALHLKQIIAANDEILIYVSSEQAIKVLLKYQISLDKITFKSNYLKDFAKSQ